MRFVPMTGEAAGTLRSELGAQWGCGPIPVVLGAGLAGLAWQFARAVLHANL